MVEFRACPFCGGEIDGPNFVQCNYGHGGRKETDFCSYGERKDNDEH